MSITADSTLDAVFLANIADWKPTDSDTKVWVKLAPATGDTVYTTTVGLFGEDLTDFLDDCAVATKNCKPADYDGYSGWAFGINIAGNAVATNTNTVSFETLKYSVALTWGDSTAATPTFNTVKAGTIAAAPAEAVPANAAAITADTKTDPFNSFSGKFG